MVDLLTSSAPVVQQLLLLTSSEKCKCYTQMLYPSTSVMMLSVFCGLVSWNFRWFKPIFSLALFFRKFGFEICQLSVMSKALFSHPVLPLLPLPEWCQWRASGTCSRRGMYPSPSSRWAGLSRNNRVVQGRLYPGSAGVPAVAHWGVRPAGGPFLRHIWHLCTLEHHLAKCP